MTRTRAELTGAWAEPLWGGPLRRAPCHDGASDAVKARETGVGEFRRVGGHHSMVIAVQAIAGVIDARPCGTRGAVDGPRGMADQPRYDGPARPEAGHGVGRSGQIADATLQLILSAA